MPGITEEAKTPTTVKEVTEQIEGTLAKMRDANDRMEEGKADKVEVERLNNEITRLKGVAEDIKKDMGRSSVGVSSGDAAAEAKAAAEFFTTVKNRIVSPKEADVDEYREYKGAFNSFIRAGGNLDLAGVGVRNALSVGTDPSGGYFVPAEMSTELVKRIYDTSPMRRIARRVSIGTDAWEAPYQSSKGTSGGWVGETSSRSETDTPDVGMQRIPVREQFAFPKLTQKMLEDASFDVEDYLIKETEDEMVRTENKGFVTGAGAPLEPKGFLSYLSDAATTDDDTRDWGKLQYVPTGKDGAFDTLSGGATNLDPLIDLRYKLNAQYRPSAVWTMNSNTEAELRKAKDNEGRYLMNMGSVEGNVVFQLFGHRIENLEDMPDIASNSGSIAFGDFRRGYLIVDRRGFYLLRDPYTDKPYVGLYIRKRVGGDVRNFDAIKVLKFSAT